LAGSNCPAILAKTPLDGGFVFSGNSVSAAETLLPFAAKLQLCAFDQPHSGQGPPTATSIARAKALIASEFPKRAALWLRVTILVRQMLLYY
jgi:hypothetical protein